MKRAFILAAPLALTLTIVGCGDDDDAPDETAAPAATIPDVTIPDVTLPDISLPDVTLPDISLPDISLPDISLPDISLPDISLPDISLPENADELIGQFFPNLDEAQISCLVENLDGQFDPSAVTQLASECDIAFADLVPGG